MSSWKPYSRRELGRLRRAWLRRNAGLVLAAAAGTALGAAGLTWAVATLITSTCRWYILGALHAGLVAGVLHVLNSAFLALDRDAIHHVRGARGEENTRDVLTNSRLKRTIWGSVDSINLKAGDLDHVVVTRRAGLIVIDSKWRSNVDESGIREMAQDALKAKARADGIARTLLGKERGSHRARVQSLAVSPVVVIWGSAMATVPPGAEVMGVPFVRGTDLGRWLRSLDGPPIPKEAALDLLRRLRDFRESAWQNA